MLKPTKSAKRLGIKNYKKNIWKEKGILKVLHYLNIIKKKIERRSTQRFIIISSY